MFFLFFFLFGYIKAQILDEILKADNAKSLRMILEVYKKKTSLKELCQKQQKHRAPPTACYALSLDSNPWCLRLSVRDLDLEVIEKALESGLLSSFCQTHLKKKAKILFYREKDFFLPELKNIGQP